MQEQLTKYCIFGDEKLSFTGKQELQERTIWTWESVRKDLAGNNALRVRIISDGDLVRRAAITESRGGKSITTEFDSSCNLIRDTKSANNVNYMLLAREHAGEFSTFLDRVRTLYQLHSSKELFMIRRIRESDEKEAKTLFPQEFSNTAKIVNGPYVLLHPPNNVANAMGLRHGSLGELTLDGKSLVFTPLKKRQYEVKTYMGSTSLQVSLPRELVQLKGIYFGTMVEWSQEGPMKLSMRPINEQGKKGLTVSYSQTGNVHNVVIPKTFNLKGGLYGILTDEGEKLVLELSTTHRHIARISAVDRMYGEEFFLYVPKELAEQMDLKRLMEVGFAINGKGQLVITPR
jgi:antitoxin component of MazEF toxin-antitoxin module